MSIDPNVTKWLVNYANDPNPPDFKSLQDAKAAVDQQLVNTPASHPSRTSLVAQQTTLATAIANHPKRSGS